MVEYFQGVRSEVDKVVWPTRPETRRLSTVVLIVLIISAIVLGAISGGFSEIFRLGLQNPVVLLAFMFLGAGALYLIGRFVFGASQESRY
ncbi:MAG: preprotein translocase subunit SecE [Anaerolineae bacterium]|nr:preprotein translocase subunit SecE [Anaerolineae bacterium]